MMSKDSKVRWKEGHLDNLKLRVEIDGYEEDGGWMWRFGVVDVSDM